MVNNNPKIIEPKEYFLRPKNLFHKKYEALRLFFVDKKSAEYVAKKFGYKLSSFYSITRDFRSSLSLGDPERCFFIESMQGRNEIDITGNIYTMIIDLRKKYLSVPDIKATLDAGMHKVSEKYVYNVIHKAGFARLPRRDKIEKIRISSEIKIEAPKSNMLDFSEEEFTTQCSIGVLCFIPIIKKYGIDRLIEESDYPGTKNISNLTSILSFIALKLSSIQRYNADDIWCNDRGLGLFSGLNVLPKTAWFSSYSSRVTKEMNFNFLKRLHNIWQENSLLSDTVNLDFVTIPYWGDDSACENNWSGKRGKVLASMLAVLAQDPDSGIIDYGDTTVRHKNESKIVLEFLDFYEADKFEKKKLKYLVFDSKFTAYENLRKLDDRKIKFVTIRRRGKNIVDRLNNLPKAVWKKIHVMNADGKGRSLKVLEEYVFIRGYGKKIRQLSITDHGKIKPALIITNDDTISKEDLVRKYSRRWIVEKGISEQTDFFHLNRVSSSMVIKVDFDLCMTILSYNLYRVLASNLDGYSHNTARTLFDKFIYNSGTVKISSDSINVSMKKKRNLPLLLSEMNKYKNETIPWFGNLKINFYGSTTS
jgi:hypothetical protein